jgi:16S rRNA (cytosine967-C5)-methyltransferase
MTTDARISPERLVALRVLRRVADGAFADRALAAEARKAGLDPRDRAAAMRLTYGAVQRRRTLDWLIDGALERPAALEPDVREVLRLGAYELLWSDRVPAAAAVDQTVRLVRTLHGVPRRRTARAGLVNAVLRRIADDGRTQLDALEGDPARLGIRYSLPDWIVDGLTESLGPEAEGVMAAANEPAESALRWNPLRGPRDAVVDALPVPWHDDPDLPEAIVLEGRFGIEDSELWTAGRAMAQSRASMLPARVLDPRPGERILDLCAAPGAKSTHLAALSCNEAEIVCVELHEARARALRGLGERMGARLDVRVGDGRTLELDRGFDAILVDPPCTGLGVLSARPDARWRRRPEALDELVGLQRALLARALELVRPGGRVVYSTCTLLAVENEDAVRAAGGAAADLSGSFGRWAHPRLPGALLTLPGRDGTDGFFVARIEA